MMPTRMLRRRQMKYTSGNSATIRPGTYHGDQKVDANARADRVAPGTKS